MNQETDKKKWGGYRPGAGRKPIGAGFTIQAKIKTAPTPKPEKQSKAMVKPEVAKQPKVEIKASALPDYEDPLKFLTGVMTDSGVEDRFRIDAAKALMPYIYAKKTVDEKLGKKEQVEEEAKTNHEGTSWGELLPSGPVQ
jgi:hypothetical protein